MLRQIAGLLDMLGQIAGLLDMLRQIAGMLGNDATDSKTCCDR